VPTFPQVTGYLLLDFEGKRRRSGVGAVSGKDRIFKSADTFVVVVQLLVEFPHDASDTIENLYTEARPRDEYGPNKQLQPL